MAPPRIGGCHRFCREEVKPASGCGLWVTTQCRELTFESRVTPSAFWLTRSLGAR